MNNQSKFDKYMKSKKNIPSNRMEMCKKIQSSALEYEVVISLEDAHTLWLDYSKSLNIAWMDNYHSEVYEAEGISEAIEKAIA